MEINVTDINKTQENYFFQPIPVKALEGTEIKQILSKWGLFDTLKIGSFRFNQPYQDFDSSRFLEDLFSNPNTKYIFQNSLTIESPTIKQIKSNKLRCTQLSMEIFDRLQQNKIVSGSYISKTYSQFFQGIQICDKLRQTILMEQSQYYCIFDENQRKQFLFRLFQLLVIGGSLNQYQDTITPYLDWTKKIYKTLVAVRKKYDSGDIYVESEVYQIQSIDKDKLIDSNPQNIVYVIINPSLRTVHIIVNKWVKFW